MDAEDQGGVSWIIVCLSSLCDGGEPMGCGWMRRTAAAVGLGWQQRL
nr:hypothetical protein [Tanacetum cinerariifolium]